jgi:hypothetical protein
VSGDAIDRLRGDVALAQVSLEQPRQLRDAMADEHVADRR